MIVGTGLVVTIAAAVAWATFDVVRKYLARSHRPVALATALILLQTPPLLAWVAIDGAWSVTPGYWPPALTAIACQVGANVTFVLALRISGLAATIPMLSLTPVFSAILGQLVLDEDLAVRQVVGVCVVLVGALSLNVTRAGGLNPLRDVVRERGALLMVGVALLWAATAALDKLSMRHAAPSTHALIQSAGVATALLVYVLTTGRARELGAVLRHAPTLVGGMLLSAAAFGAQLVAISLVPIGIYEGIKRAIGLSAAVINGRLLFGEAITVARVVAVALMTGGVFLLVL